MDERQPGPSPQQADQRARIQALVADEPAVDGLASGTIGWLDRLCRVASRELLASGTGVSVMTDDGAQTMAAASDPTSELIEDLQFSLGEGPCLDAYAGRRPVLEPALVVGAAARWPVYSPAAHDYGVRAVFAFPLQVGAARLGALDVYRDQPGPLSADALSEALTFAEIAVMTLLDGQEQVAGSGPADGLDEALDNRTELYQAQGMVMIQLGVTVTEAMARLRAHAFAHERRLGDVARDVVQRELVLERDA